MNDELATFHLGDCVEVMATMPDASVDAVVTDPPYGLEFMGKEWDNVGRRTNHPLDPSMAITNGEPEKGNPWASERSGYGAPKKNARCRKCQRLRFDRDKYRCQCEAPDWDTRTREYASVMQDWHTRWATEAYRLLKPGGYLLAFGGTRTYHRLASAIEDAGFEIRDCLVWAYASGFPKSLDVSKAIDKAAGAEREVVGSKLGQPGYADTENTGRMLPLSPGASGGYLDVTAPATDAAKRWQGWGTALKPAWEPIVMARKPLIGTVAANVAAHSTGAINIDAIRIGENGNARWPSNVLLTAPLFDGGVDGVVGAEPGYSRFFLIPKAGRSDREPVLRPDDHPADKRFSTHPTMKPTELMRHLVRLVTPPGGVVLDCFLGSGTTAIAANMEGFRCIGIEREAEYLEIAKARMVHQQVGAGL